MKHKWLSGNKGMAKQIYKKASDIKNYNIGKIKGAVKNRGSMK